MNDKKCLKMCFKGFQFCKNVNKKNMFTINLEDGREAPSKASTYIYEQRDK